jgi:TRAP-type mannitol/chloroaromatic compound transport system permease small subunit
MLVLPHTVLSRRVSGAIRRFAEYLSLVWLLLLAIIVLNVVMRYLFAEGRIEFEEIQWHLYSIGFLFGLSVAYDVDVHIRVDVVRDKLKPQTQAWVELYGTLCLLLPFIVLVLVASVPLVSYSFANSEVSQAPGGLGYRWLIKACLPMGFLLLLLVTVARLSRVCCYLFGWPGPALGTGAPAEPSAGVSDVRR